MSFRERKAPGFSQHRGYVSIGEENSQEIECEEGLTCYGYKTSYCKQFIFHVFAVLFAGIPYLFLHWYCQYVAYTKYLKCSLEEADILLIQVINLMFYYFPHAKENRVMGRCELFRDFFLKKFCILPLVS
jgi:hypothetical protein